MAPMVRRKRRLILVARVTNAGSTSATGTVLQMALPPSFRHSSVLPPGCTAAPLPGGVTCALGTLAAGQTREILLPGSFAFDGTAFATAAVRRTGADPPADNFATLVVEVDEESDGDGSDDDDNGGRSGGGGGSGADLSINQTDSPDPAVVADGNPGNCGSDNTIQYRAELTNEGPRAATQASFSFAVTNGRICSVSFNDDFPCTLPPSPVTTATCGPARLASGETASAVIFVQATAPGTASSTVTATSSTPDPDPANNSDTDTTTVTAPTITRKVGTLDASCRADPDQEESNLPFSCAEPLESRDADDDQDDGEDASDEPGAGDDAAEGGEGGEDAGAEPDAGNTADSVDSTDEAP